MSEKPYMSGQPNDDSTPYGTAKLSNAERERLALLAEEMGAAIYIIGKILRLGYRTRRLADHGAEFNRTSLERNLADVRVAMDLMEKAGDISFLQIDLFAERKAARVAQYMSHQPPPKK